MKKPKLHLIPLPEDVSLSLDEIKVLHQLLGEVKATPDGNVAKLRTKLDGLLKGTHPARLAGAELRFLRDLLRIFIFLRDDRPSEPITQIISKLTKQLRY